MPKRRQYGSGGITQRKDGRWYGTIEAGYTQNGTRRRISVSAKTESKCKRRLAAKQHEIARQGIPSQTGRMTVKRYADEWETVTVNKLRPLAYTANRSAIRQWIVPTIGHRRLDQLTPADVRAVQNKQRDAGRAVGTIVRTHVVLRSMLKAAQQDGHAVAANVLATKGPSKDQMSNDREAFPIKDALAILAVAAQLPHGTRALVAFAQGMRQGECLGLTWDRVDFDNDLLDISWQLQSLPYVVPRDKKSGFRVPDGYDARQLSGAFHLVRPKSSKGWRVIPLVPFVADALKTWRDVAPANPHGLVWPTLEGRPQSKHSDLEEWKALQCTAEVGHPSGRYYVTHEARHTTATLLLQVGVADPVVMAIIGHSTISTTRGYQHTDKTMLRTAMEAVAERLQLPQS